MREPGGPQGQRASGTAALCPPLQVTCGPGGLDPRPAPRAGGRGLRTREACPRVPGRGGHRPGETAGPRPVSMAPVGGLGAPGSGAPGAGSPGSNPTSAVRIASMPGTWGHPTPYFQEQSRGPRDWSEGPGWRVTPKDFLVSNSGGSGRSDSHRALSREGEEGRASPGWGSRTTAQHGPDPWGDPSPEAPGGSPE